MKKVAMSFLGLALAFGATQAYAQVNIGVLPQTGGFQTVILDGEVDPGVFDDIFTFTLEEDALVSISVDDLPQELAGRIIFNIDDLETSLFDSSGAEVNFFSGGSQSGDLNLMPDTYSLQIQGNATGVLGGLYLGALSVATDVSAIPIPAAGLLFFSGIAVLGLVRSKRASA